MRLTELIFPLEGLFFFFFSFPFVMSVSFGSSIQSKHVAISCVSRVEL